MEAEPPAEAVDAEAVLDELERVVRWSSEFTLAFVKCNHSAQCDAMRSAVLNRVKDKSILEVKLDGPIISLLEELKTRWKGKEAPDAVCVFGLENSVNEQREGSRILGSLNHERELIRRLIPGALLIWLPDFALDLIARLAPDFWAWRSGVYEFPTNPELWQQDSNAALSGEGGDELLSLSVEEKKQELARLKVLLRTARALPKQDRRSRATIMQLLLRLGVIYYVLGDLAAAQDCYEESLATSRTIGDRLGEAVSLHRLGMIAQNRGELSEAQDFYEKGLEMVRTLGSDVNVVAALYHLGRIAQEQKDRPKAQRLYEESLEISKRLGNQEAISRTLQQLGSLAHEQGNLSEAKRLYQEGLDIATRLGSENGVSISLHQLGRVAQDEGDLAAARRFYEESLKIDKKLGDLLGTAISLNQLGRIAEDQGRRGDASDLYREALHIFEKLKSPNENIARRNLARIESL